MKRFFTSVGFLAVAALMTGCGSSQLDNKAFSKMTTNGLAYTSSYNAEGSLVTEIRDEAAGTLLGHMDVAIGATEAKFFSSESAEPVLLTLPSNFSLEFANDFAAEAFQSVMSSSTSGIFAASTLRPNKREIRGDITQNADGTFNEAENCRYRDCIDMVIFGIHYYQCGPWQKCPW